jgi:hypothetical protein
MSRERLTLLALLALLGTVLMITSIRGVFLIDENNYMVSALALREGQLSVPGTAGLTPSPALEYFDPRPDSRARHVTPVAIAAPPLYAPLALPFTYLGWRGLVLLNVLAFLVSAALAFSWAARHATRPATPWIALALFVLGTYCIEYAQGVWPHMLSMCLCTGSAYLGSRLRVGVRRPLAVAMAAGLLAGVATGVRYQNLVFAGGVGLGVLLWTNRRWRISAAFALGCLLPLVVSALVNDHRFGWLNPVKKHPTYLTLPPHLTLGTVAPASEVNVVVETLRTFWAKVVDFSVHPEHVGEEARTWMRRVPETGAFFYLGALKKSWLQSAPWILLSLVALALCWRRRADGERVPRAAATIELRAIAAIVVPILGMFAVAGAARQDGMCFNQRYFIEMLPLMAVAAAWMLDGIALPRWPLAVGAAATAVVVVALLRLDPEDHFRQLALLKLPLVLAALLLAGWFFAVHRPQSPAKLVLPLLVGASLAWALGVHLGDDLAVSREIRHFNAARLAAVEDALPAHEPAAIFAYWTSKDALGPLQLRRDLVIVDPSADDGESAARLRQELFSVRRRVFALVSGMPRPIIEKIAVGHFLRLVRREPPIIELRP